MLVDQCLGILISDSRVGQGSVGDGNHRLPTYIPQRLVRHILKQSDNIYLQPYDSLNV